MLKGRIILLKDNVACEFKISAELIGYLGVESSVLLTTQELDIICNLTHKLVKQLHLEEIDFSKLPRLHLFFTTDGSMSLIPSINSPQNVLGFHAEIISIAVDHLRKRYPEPKRYKLMFELTIIEELCHAIWQIRNEIDVKHKVWEVFFITFDSPYPYDKFYSELYTSDGKARPFEK